MDPERPTLNERRDALLQRIERERTGLAASFEVLRPLLRRTGQAARVMRHLRDHPLLLGAVTAGATALWTALRRRKTPRCADRAVGWVGIDRAVKLLSVLHSLRKR